MKVLSVSVKRKGLSAVTLEDGREILIDTELLSLKGITQKSEIENIEKLLSESDFKRAKSRALWYLSRRDHSEKELKEKLIKGGFSPEVSALAVERMGEIGLVDDYSFAKRFYEQLTVYGNSSVREAKYKLKLKGISPEIITEITEENSTDEGENIKQLIEKKYASRLETEDGVKKVFASLLRKGFSYSDIRKALKDYSNELECEDF